ncbi:MAG: hypothetical protein ABSB12_02950 [Candidatus Saccharimonadales bacterium]|jgi:hypothetical protein
MSERSKCNSGFTVVEIVLIVAAAVLICAVGYIVFSHNDETASQIILQRQQYIDKNISNLSIQNYTSLGTSLYKQGYLTTSLYLTTQSLINDFTNGDFNSNPAYNKMICVDQIPSSYSYGLANISSDGNAATISVNVFVPGSVSHVPYTGYWVNTNGTWQLNDIDCSQGSSTLF